MIDAVLVIVVTIGLGAATILVARSPSFWKPERHRLESPLVRRWRTGARYLSARSPHAMHWVYA